MLRESRVFERHPLFRVRMLHSPNQLAAAGTAGDDRGPAGLAGPKGIRPEQQAQVSLSTDTPVTGDAVLVENRSDVTIEVDLMRRSSVYVQRYACEEDDREGYPGYRKTAAHYDMELRLGVDRHR